MDKPEILSRFKNNGKDVKLYCFNCRSHQIVNADTMTCYEWLYDERKKVEKEAIYSCPNCGKTDIWPVVKEYIGGGEGGFS